MNTIRKFAILLLSVSACGNDLDLVECMQSLPADPEPQVYGEYFLPCGTIVKVADDVPRWVGTAAWGREVCKIIENVSNIAGAEIDPATITLSPEREVLWKDKPVYGVTVPKGDYFLVRIRVDDEFRCMSYGSFAHEALHVALNGDGGHSSPLWKNIIDRAADCKACAETAAAGSEH